MAQGWLIIERIENWEIDEANNFAFFGLTERYRKPASEIAPNDLVICYVSSGRSAFSDVRRVQEAGLKKLKVQSYASAFPYYISTVPVISLPQDKWIPIKEIDSELDLTRGRKDYRMLFQTSIRRLTANDTEYLHNKIKAAQ